MNLSDRRISIRAMLVIVLIAIAGTAVALTSTTITGEKISLFDAGTSPTDLDITAYATNVLSANELGVEVTASNNDATGHHANITVSVLDAAGNSLASDTQATGLVSSGASVTLSYSFAQTDIATNYESSFVVVKQSS